MRSKGRMILNEIADIFVIRAIPGPLRLSNFPIRRTSRFFAQSRASVGSIEGVRAGHVAYRLLTRVQTGQCFLLRFATRPNGMLKKTYYVRLRSRNVAREALSRNKGATSTMKVRTRGTTISETSI